MNKIMISLMLVLTPASFALAQIPDACQTLAKISPQSVLSCYKNQTNNAQQAAKNKFVGNFIAGLGGGGIVPPQNNTGNSPNADQSDNSGSQNNQQQTQSSSSSNQQKSTGSGVKYY